jgi:hypothetical protein
MEVLEDLTSASASLLPSRFLVLLVYELENMLKFECRWKSRAYKELIRIGNASRVVADRLPSHSVSGSDGCSH